MAARRNLSHSAEVRAKIGAGQLISRLRRYALGDERVTMTRGQVSAALGLLRKAVPDLSSVDVGNADGEPLRISIIKFNDLTDEDKPEER
jgi:hypothetical protein